MTVNEIKHQAKLAEWKEHILECRSQGLSVGEWCARNGYHRTSAHLISCCTTHNIGIQAG